MNCISSPFSLCIPLKKHAGLRCLMNGIWTRCLLDYVLYQDFQFLCDLQSGWFFVQTGKFTYTRTLTHHQHIFGNVEGQISQQICTFFFCFFWSSLLHTAIARHRNRERDKSQRQKPSRLGPFEGRILIAISPPLCHESTWFALCIGHYHLLL